MATLHYRSDFSGGSGRTNNTVAPKTVEKDFINSDLAQGKLIINHNLGKKFATVQIWNNEGEPIIPDKINVTNENTATITLLSFQPITETWHITIS